MRTSLIACHSLLIFSLGIHPGFADDGPEMSRDWGQVIRPDGDSQVRIDGQKLTIEYGPGVKKLDAEGGGMNSPRVLQELSGDFSIQVTVDGDLPLPALDGKKTRAYISGGLVVFQDEKNYIRLERASFTRQGTIWHYANFEQRINARRTRMGRFADFPLQPAKPVELRLEIKGETVRALVRHVGDDWHELGIAKMHNRDRLLAGVSGVKTDAGRAEVCFLNLQVSKDPIAADAESASEIDLNEMRQIIRTQKPENVRWRDLIAEVEELQRRGKKVATLSEVEQTLLINDAKRVGTTKTPKMKAYLGPSIARRLAESFSKAGLSRQSIRVYREFAESLEKLGEDGLREVIGSLRQSADDLENKLLSRKAEKDHC
ncbi:DUF1349 domain-containing protein [Aporhodopirellula aestuarii]|uniref:Uncharacterized protein n=1 Tax=Aporhodopirellula aestuarii TaxID=2950107 RepID=A0ABT0U603_9BACT|nr:hypothetical protein [Aporhodopirellula aestuarii]MCM2372333.1 hypothetical protein [Aporhodopirellula aestuarii]